MCLVSYWHNEVIMNIFASIIFLSLSPGQWLHIMWLWYLIWCILCLVLNARNSWNGQLSWWTRWKITCPFMYIEMSWNMIVFVMAQCVLNRLKLPMLNTRFTFYGQTHQGLLSVSIALTSIWKFLHQNNEKNLILC